MKIILRKQYVNFEPYEYEFVGSVDLEKIKEEFVKFPWEEQIKLKEQLVGFHVSPAFNLEYKNKELTITGYHNGQFAVQYNHWFILRWQFSANMFNTEEVFHLIDKFPILKPNQFKKILSEKSTIEESLLSILVITLTNKRKKIFSTYTSEIRNQYRMTFKNLFYCFGFSLIWLLMPLGFDIYIGFKISTTVFVIFQGFCLLLALPAIIISLNHFSHNGKLKLQFKKGENNFEIINGSQSLQFDKRKVVKIIEFASNGARAPWSLYSYSILQFEDGSKVWLSNILISSVELNKQFYTVKTEYKEVWIPLFKKTMILNRNVPN